MMCGKMMDITPGISFQYRLRPEVEEVIAVHCPIPTPTTVCLYHTKENEGAPKSTEDSVG